MVSNGAMCESFRENWASLGQVRSATRQTYGSLCTLILAHSSLPYHWNHQPDWPSKEEDTQKAMNGGGSTDMGNVSHSEPPILFIIIRSEPPAHSLAPPLVPPAFPPLALSVPLRVSLSLPLCRSVCLCLLLTSAVTEIPAIHPSFKIDTQYGNHHPGFTEYPSAQY